MKTNNPSLRLAVLVVGAVVAGAGAPVFGQPSLWSIGVPDPTSSSIANSEIRAVSQDGSYVVGTSLAPGGTIKVPAIWSRSVYARFPGHARPTSKPSSLAVGCEHGHD